MKKFLFIATLVLLVSCAKQTITTYEYSAKGRGYQLTVTVTEDSTILTEQVIREDANSTVYPTNPALWNSLNKHSKKIKLNDISELESPTNKRAFDAALYGKMTFKTKDSVYVSSSFDAGQPHLMLKPVVDSLANLKKKD